MLKEKSIKVFKGTKLTLTVVDKESGSYVLSCGNDVLHKGTVKECSFCGRKIYNSTRPIDICDSCHQKVAVNLVVPQKDKEEKPIIEKRRVGRPPKSTAENVVASVRGKGKRPRRSIRSIVKTYKSTIEVPKLQQYLDVLDGMSNTWNIDTRKDTTLMILDLIAKHKNLDKMANAVGCNRHTLYCYLLHYRRVNLVSTPDYKNYEIKTPYYLNNK